MAALKKDVAGVTVVEFATLGLSFVNGVIVARTLGPSGRGVIALALTIPMLLSSIGDLGMGEGMIHYVRRREGDESTLLSSVLIVTAGLGLLYVVLSAALGAVLRTSVLRGVPLVVVVWASLITPLEMIRNEAGAYAMGRGRVRAYNTLSLSNYGLTLLATVVMVLVLRLGTAGAIWAQLVGSALSAVIGLAVAIRVSDGRPRRLVDFGHVRRVVRFGLRIVVGNLAQKLNYRFDSFVLNYFAGPGVVGVYAVAARFAELLLVAPRVLRLLWFASVSETPEANDLERTRGLVRKILRPLAILTPAFAVVGGVGIRIAYGPEYVPAILPFVLLLPGTLVLSIAMPYVGALAGRGAPEKVSYAAWITLAVTITLDLALIPFFGIVGAALASTASYATFLLVARGFWVRQVTAVSSETR